MTERRVKDGKFHIMEQALLMSIHHFAFSSFRSAASTSGGLGPPATAEQHLLFASYMPKVRFRTTLCCSFRVVRRLTCTRGNTKRV